MKRREDGGEGDKGSNCRLEQETRRADENTENTNGVDSKEQKQEEVGAPHVDLVRFLSSFAGDDLYAFFRLWVRIDVTASRIVCACTLT